MNAILIIMRPVKYPAFIKLTAIFLCPCFSALHAQIHDNSYTAEPAESKRIEVYALSQNYWDTQQGDSLSLIAQHLLPNNPHKREALMQDIMMLNPAAFIGGDADRLLAGKRLLLPGYMKQADSIADPATTTVERYSWGNIKREK